MENANKLSLSYNKKSVQPQPKNLSIVRRSILWKFIARIKPSKSCSKITETFSYRFY